jgi:hypothetical protein
MVTDSLQVLLIECNVSPDITLSTPVTSRVVKAAVRETFSLVMGSTTTTTTTASSSSSPSWNLWFPDSSSSPLTSTLAFARSKRERGGALGKDYSPKKMELFSKVQTLLSSGEAGDEAEDWIDRERQDGRSLLLSASPLPAEGLCLAMAAFEDELLRDDDQDELLDPHEVYAGDGSQQWTLRLRQNTALLTIPVKLTQLPGPTGASEPLLFELRLRVRLDSLSTSSSSSSSAFTSQSIILPFRVIFELPIPLV